MLQEKNHAGAFLVKSTLDHYGRIPVTILSGENLEAGTVLGKVTASGKYVAFDNAAGDGRETVAGILWDNTDASGGDTEAVIVAVGRGDHVVDGSLLKWAAGVDSGEQTAAITAMAALGIFVEGL